MEQGSSTQSNSNPIQDKITMRLKSFIEQETHKFMVDEISTLIQLELKKYISSKEFLDLVSELKSTVNQNAKRNLLETSHELNASNRSDRTKLLDTVTPSIVSIDSKSDNMGGSIDIQSSNANPTVTETINHTEQSDSLHAANALRLKLLLEKKEEEKRKHAIAEASAEQANKRAKLVFGIKSKKVGSIL